MEKKTTLTTLTTLTSGPQGNVRALGVAVAMVLVQGLLTGCFSPVKRIAERTALEQQLVVVAVARAVARLDLSDKPIPGTYRVVVTAPADADAGLIRASLERRLYDEGLQLNRKEATKVPTIEAKVSFAGSELESTLLGVPLFVPGVPFAFGDLSLYKSTTQRGRARLGLTLWDANGNLEAHVPEVEGTSYFTNYSFLTFIGDFISTDMEDFVSPGKEKKQSTPKDPNPEPVAVSDAEGRGGEG